MLARLCWPGYAGATAGSNRQEVSFFFTAISDVCSEFRKLRFREDHRKICVQYVTHVQLYVSGPQALHLRSFRRALSRGR